MSPAGPPVPTPSPVPTYNPKADAEKYTLLLWNHIGMRIVNLLKNHHLQHEPGGLDQVKLPLSALKDVVFPTTPVDGNVLTYDASWPRWTHKPPSGGGGVHQVHFALLLPALVVPPGPINITGAAMTISAVKFRTDDSTVSGSLSVGSNSYSIGTDYSGLTHTWGTNVVMTLALTDYGSDGTYLCIDVAAG